MTSSLLERVSAVLGPSSPEAIQAKLDAVRAALPDLESRVGDLAYQVELGDATATAKLATAKTALNDARDRIENLSLSLIRANAARDQATEASREKLRISQREAVRQHLAHRTEAGQRLAIAMGQMIEAWHDLVQHTEEMVKAAPLGEPFPAGTTSTFHEIKAAIADELWRQGGDPLNAGRGFPGAKSSNLMFLNNPAAAPELVKTLRQSGDFILNRVVNVKSKAGV
jgi:hypothetical protein